MFGSGDDKNSKRPADNADSQSPEEQQNEAAAEKPARKGLFSWFGRKKSDPKTEPTSPVETTPAETEEQAELPKHDAVEAEEKTAPAAEHRADEAVAAETAEPIDEPQPNSRARSRGASASCSY